MPSPGPRFLRSSRSGGQYRSLGTGIYPDHWASYHLCSFLAHRVGCRAMPPLPGPFPALPTSVDLPSAAFTIQESDVSSAVLSVSFG